MFKEWIKEQVSDILDTVKDEAKVKYEAAMEEFDSKIHGITELLECYKMSLRMEWQEEFKKIHEMQAKILKELENFKSRLKF